MRNATTSTERILMVIEVRYDKNGHIYANSHHGWTVTDYPQQCTQCETFSRGRYRIKVVVYGTPIEYINTFGAYLAAALIEGDKNPMIWRNVNLNE